MTYNPTWGSGGGGGLTDGDKGDIVVSGGGTVLSLDSAVVTSAGRALLDDANAAAQRSTLGLGTAATEASSAFAAAAHTHPQSDVTGLVTALSGKSDVGHGHAQSEITGLVTALSGKANTAHTHVQADVTGLVTALAGKADTSHTHDASAIVSGTFADARIGLNSVKQHESGLAFTVSQITDLSLPAEKLRTAFLVSDSSGIYGASYADIPSLGFLLNATTSYGFHFYIHADADAATTGIDVAVTGPASPAKIAYTQFYWTSTTANAFRHATAYDANTASTASNGTATRIFEVYGYIRTSVSGLLVARIKREAVGSGPTVRAGSFGLLYLL